MKISKRLVLGICSSFLILAIGLIIAIQFISLDGLKPKIAQLFKENSGKELEIKGPIELAWRLPLQANVHDLLIDKKYKIKRALVSINLASTDKHHVRLYGVSVNGNKLADSVNVYLSQKDKITLINGDMSSDSLNITKALDALSNKSNNTKSSKVFSTEKIDLSSLKNIDLQFGIHVKSATYGDINLEKINVKLVNSANKLSLKSMQPIQYHSGSINADLLIEKKKSLFVKFNSDGTNLTIPRREDLTNAPLTYTINVQGAGNTMAQIMSSLNGPVILELGKGQVYAKEFNQLGWGLDSVFSKINPLAKKHSTAELSCAVLALNFKNGIGHCNKGLAIESNQLNLVGQGTVNFRNENLNLELAAKTSGKLDLAVGEVSNVVKVGGTLKDPQPKVNAKGLLTEGVSLFGAIATGGASLLAKGLFDNLTTNAHPCNTARQSVK